MQSTGDDHTNDRRSFAEPEENRNEEASADEEWDEEEEGCDDDGATQVGDSQPHAQHYAQPPRWEEQQQRQQQDQAQYTPQRRSEPTNFQDRSEAYSEVDSPGYDDDYEHNVPENQQETGVFDEELEKKQIEVLKKLSLEEHEADEEWRTKHDIKRAQDESLEHWRQRQAEHDEWEQRAMHESRVEHTRCMAEWEQQEAEHTRQAQLASLDSVMEDHKARSRRRSNMTHADVEEADSATASRLPSMMSASRVAPQRQHIGPFGTQTSIGSRSGLSEGFVDADEHDGLESDSSTVRADPMDPIGVDGYRGPRYAGPPGRTPAAASDTGRNTKPSKSFLDRLQFGSKGGRKSHAESEQPRSARHGSAAIDEQDVHALRPASLRSQASRASQMPEYVGSAGARSDVQDQGHQEFQRYQPLYPSVATSEADWDTIIDDGRSEISFTAPPLQSPSPPRTIRTASQNRPREEAERDRLFRDRGRRYGADHTSGSDESFGKGQ